MQQRALFSILFALIFITKFADATIILPTPINRQVKESFAAVQGVNNGKVFKRDKNGNVFTEYSFKLSMSVGLNTNKIINLNTFKIIAPGGVWNDKTYKTVGAPTFVKGKEYVLLLDKVPFGFVVHGLSIGQYEIVKTDGTLYLKSFTFANHPKIGKIPYAEFENLLRNNFGSSFESASIKDKSIYVKKKTKRRVGRNVASIEGAEQETGAGAANVLWLVLILASLGSLSAFFLNRDRR